MICEDYKCKYWTGITEDLSAGTCAVYPFMGQQLRYRLGYCPVLNDGPNKPRTKEAAHKRVGQQHQKKVKGKK